MRLLVAFACITLAAPASRAQDLAMSAPERLLDKMTGQWVMTGTIAKKPTTHDVDVEWVLKRQYIRIREVSRDKDASGGIGYEAWIYIVWDAKTSEYAVMWLDNTAATNFSADGSATRSRTATASRSFSRTRTGAAFTPPSRTIARRIRGHGRSTTWIEGKASRFATLTLTRKK